MDASRNIPTKQSCSSAVTAANKIDRFGAGDFAHTRASSSKIHFPSRYPPRRCKSGPLQRRIDSEMIVVRRIQNRFFFQLRIRPFQLATTFRETNGRKSLARCALRCTGNSTGLNSRVCAFLYNSSKFSPANPTSFFATFNWIHDAASNFGVPSRRK